MTCSCECCLQRARQGLPRHPGVSEFKDVHVTAEDLIDPSEQARKDAEAEQRAIETTRRAVMVMRPAARRRFVSIRTLGEIVRILRAEVEAETSSLRRKVEELEASLQTEHRLAAVERMLPDFRQEQPPQFGQWSPEYSSWRGQQ